MEHFDILIIGAGAAGLAAAKAAHGEGCRSIAIVDDRPAPGGILLQCSHRGFANELSGPEYIGELMEDFPSHIRFFPGTTVLAVNPDRTALLSQAGLISFSRLILAAGGRETPIGALPICGTRPEGVYTAGQMQELMNLHGFVPPSPVLILGGGDLGLIMAEQCALAGLQVTVAEKEEHCSALPKNLHRLEHENIRLICGVTAEELFGIPKLEGCRLSNGEYIPCSTLLSAVGLRCERELVSHLANPSWLYLCGNCSRIHRKIESVTKEGMQAGIMACRSLEA